MVATIRSLRAIIRRTRISYSTLAVLCRVSPGTVRTCLAVGELPRRRAPAAALVRFARANAKAARREDLRLV